MMSDIDFLSLVDACMCTNIRKVSRIITRVYDKYLEPAGLNINQLGLLLTIKGNNQLASDTSVGAIGDRMVMEKSTLSRNMRKLEERELIIMQVNPENRSQKQAFITDKGLTAVLDAYQYWDEIQQRIRRKIGDDKFSQLIGLLTDLQDDLEEEFSDLF